MRFLLALAAILLVVSTLSQTTSARRDPPAAASVVPSAEIVVFEVESCLTCDLFRRDVWPGYRNSPRHATVPLRFVDVRRTDLSQWQLQAPVGIVPTVVMLKEGREIGRISGYMGPENFFQSVRYVMGGAED